MDIDVLNLLKIVAKRWYAVLFAALIAAGILFVYSNFFITPQYISTATLYVNNSSVVDGVEKKTSSDVAAAQQMAQTYLTFFKSDSVASAVSDEINNQYSKNQIKGFVTAVTPNETEIIEISVKISNAKMSQKIANLIVTEGISKINNVTKSSNIQIIDEADVPQSKASPNVKFYTLSGFIIGLFLSIAAILIYNSFNTHIKTSTDFSEKFKDISVIGVIPKM